MRKKRKRQTRKKYMKRESSAHWLCPESSNLCVCYNNNNSPFGAHFFSPSHSNTHTHSQAEAEAQNIEIEYETAAAFSSPPPSQCCLSFELSIVVERFKCPNSIENDEIRRRRKKCFGKQRQIQTVWDTKCTAMNDLFSFELIRMNEHVHNYFVGKPSCTVSECERMSVSLCVREFKSPLSFIRILQL